MLEAGEDARFVARRIVISAAEDVGMADPTALQTAVAAAQAVQLIGMPEGRIILAEAVVHLATAPKSNAAYMGINQAIADVRAGLGNGIPAHLRDAHYPGSKQLGHGEGLQVRPRCTALPWPPSSTRRTTSSAATTMNPPPTAPNATSPPGSSGSGRSSAANDRPAGGCPLLVRRPCAPESAVDIGAKRSNVELRQHGSADRPCGAGDSAAHRRLRYPDPGTAAGFAPSQLIQRERSRPSSPEVSHEINFVTAMAVKSFDVPDKKRCPDKAEFDLCTVNDYSVARLILGPGWRWSENTRPYEQTDVPAPPSRLLYFR